MRSRTRQLEEQDRELLKFHERIGDLWLKVPDLKEQLDIERADRKLIEEEYWHKVEAFTELRSELAKLQKNLATANQQLDGVTADRQQLQAQLESTREELASKCEELEELQRNPAPAIEPIDPYVFLDWLKGLIKGKSRKPPQWEPTKADVEAILERARQP